MKLSCRVGWHNWGKWRFVKLIRWDGIDRSPWQTHYEDLYKRTCKDCEFKDYKRVRI